MTIKRIDPMSFAKISGALYVILGFIIGVFFALVSMLGPGFPRTGIPFGGLFGMIFGVGAIVIFPIFYGLIGFVGTLCMAAIYNGLAKVVGGVVLFTE
jgi:hypothetical protein